MTNRRTRFDGQSQAGKSQLKDVRRQISLARDASLRGNDQVFVQHVTAARATLAELADKTERDIQSGFDGTAMSNPALQSISTLLGSGSTIPVLLPSYEPISHPLAVLTYPEATPLAWSVAIVVDLLGLASQFLILIIKGRQFRT